ncbi:MAG: DUF4336 domain-containing protein [Caulobacteraceae bacterium]|nr:DUF4336 domain-containing protein [Caulobacteraceae bacterium]
MLNQIGSKIWTISGGEAAVAGFRYPTQTIMIRLSDGSFVACSPVALPADLKAEIDTLGEVRHLVAPNALHHLFLAEWKAAYPQATLYAAPGLSARRPDLAFDAELSDAPPPAWAGEIDQVVVRGNAITAEVVFFHQESRTAIFTDLIQHFPRDWFTGWRGLVARLDLMAADEPQVPRKFRTAFTDRKAARAALTRILAWPTEKVVMAHGPVIERDGRAFLARTFRWLTG